MFVCKSISCLVLEASYCNHVIKSLRHYPIMGIMGIMTSHGVVVNIAVYINVILIAFVRTRQSMACLMEPLESISIVHFHASDNVRSVVSVYLLWRLSRAHWININSVKFFIRMKEAKNWKWWCLVGFSPSVYQTRFSSLLLHLVLDLINNLVSSKS